MSELVKVIELWEEFSSDNKGSSVQQFSMWLANNLQKNIGAHKKNLSSTSTQNEKLTGADDPDFEKFDGKQKSSMQGAYFVSRLNQYVSYYTKPVVKKYGLHSIDDFLYLQNVKFFANITKTKACELMLQEVTTGVDIIKRLLKNEFLIEEVNSTDKREKLLKISAKGEAVINSLYMDFFKIPDTLGNLGEDERQTLLAWLHQLDKHHNDIVKGMGKK